MKTQIIFIILALFFASCGKTEQDESDKQKNNKDGITIEGTVSSVINFFITTASANDQNCTSSCNRQTEDCAILYRLSKDQNQKDEKLCETKIANDGKYSFSITDRSKLKGEPLLVSIENFKGAKRESVFIIDDLNDRTEKNISPETTAISQALKEIAKTDRNLSKNSDEEQKQKLETDLLLMCPGVITALNVHYVLKNTINILAKENGRPLFIRFRELREAGQSLGSIQNEINEYCSLVSSLFNNQTSGNLKVRLVDKQGIPYSNMKMYIARDSRFYVSHPDGVFKTTDANGYFDLSGLVYGDYCLIIGDYNWYSTDFLWTADEKYIGTFVYDESLKYHEVVYPRVLIRQSANGAAGINLSAPDYIPPIGTKYYAQAFTLTSTTNFCGVGLGLGLGNRGRPDYLQIRSNNNGIPSTEILYENSVYGFTGALSKGGEDVFSNFCNKYTKVSLTPGIYWVVAKYNITPDVIALYGWDVMNANGISLKKSEDGVNWDEAIFSTWYNGSRTWSMLDFFITE